MFSDVLPVGEETRDLPRHSGRWQSLCELADSKEQEQRLVRVGVKDAHLSRQHW
jgi:hypothetical protein